LGPPLLEDNELFRLHLKVWSEGDLNCQDSPLQAELRGSINQQDMTFSQMNCAPVKGGAPQELNTFAECVHCSDLKLLHQVTPVRPPRAVTDTF